MASNTFGGDNDILGKTGDTIVYIFPHGAAMKSRDKQEAEHRLSHIEGAGQLTPLEAKKIDPIDPEAFINDLISRGTLTSAQVEVSRYDQENTGTSILEALVAHGWLTQAHIEGAACDFKEIRPQT
jgi:hypothetical protein